MNIADLIVRLLQFHRTERTVMVTIYKRDAEGFVISKKTLPVDTCFSHFEDHVVLTVEDKGE